MPRLAIILSHPTQYYSPWFRWLRTNTGLEFRVFYLWNFGVTAQRDRQFTTSFKWDVDLLSGYESEFVPNVARDPGTHHFNGLQNPTLRTRVQAWRPDAILMFGYAYRSLLGLILLPPAPLIFRGDSHLIGHTPSLFKRLVLRRLFSRFEAVTYVGQANRDYFRFFGVPDEKLHFAPHCVDAGLYVRSAAVAAAAAQLRNRMGLADKRVILFAGKLVPAKQPGALLDAFLSLAPSDAALVFVGDGPERARLEATAAGHRSETVHFLPFTNQSDMPVRYALADLFVLPSNGLYETWGLSVNEAMHLGVPCLVSDRVGCQRDLVTEGQTGWVFPANDPSALTQALTRALTVLRGDTSRLRQCIAGRIAGYGFAEAGRGLAAALEQIERRR
jgi:glycosyltransferase involved in cell wall biosynthesis